MSCYLALQRSIATAREIVQAKERYRTCLAKFGTHHWVSDAPITLLDDRDLPSWLREDVEEYA